MHECAGRERTRKMSNVPKKVGGQLGHKKAAADPKLTELIIECPRTKQRFASGIELVISTILQSPSFVYRVELGQKTGSIDGAVKLTPYEVASRLSYFIWGTMPDQALFQAADAGKLGNADAIAAQVERMLKDPRARSTLVAEVRAILARSA